MACCAPSLLAERALGVKLITSQMVSKAVSVRVGTC